MRRTHAILALVIVLIGIVIAISVNAFPLSGNGARIEADVAQISSQLTPYVPTIQGGTIARVVPQTKVIGSIQPKDPCAQVWQVIGNETQNSRRILVDLSHGERIKIDNFTSSYLDLSKNPRVFDWQAWADDMRAQGYTVNLLRTRPITETSLLNYDLLIIAEPDASATGPLYFTKDEASVIGNYVRRGNGLLLMGQQFMGGETQPLYIADYKGTYSYDLVLNALLSDLNLPMRFTSGKTGSDPHDMMVTNDAATKVEGSIADIWIGGGSFFIPTSTQFAAFHANSIVSNGASEVATGNKNVYTSPKNLKFSPILKPTGSMPVLIAASHMECGFVVAYGDPSAWQTRNYKGEIYRNSLYQEQAVAHAIISALTQPGGICEYLVPAGCLIVNNTTPTVTRVRVTPTIPQRTCEDCLNQCDLVTNPAERPNCFAYCSRTYGTICAPPRQQDCTPCQTVCSNPANAPECTACIAQYCDETNTQEGCSVCAENCNNDPDCLIHTCPECITTCNTCAGMCRNDPVCMRNLCPECMQEQMDVPCEDCRSICTSAPDVFACEKECGDRNRMNQCDENPCGDCWDACSGLADIELRTECRDHCELSNSCVDDTCENCRSRCDAIVNLIERSACNAICMEQMCPVQIALKAGTSTMTPGTSAAVTTGNVITTFIPGVQVSKTPAPTFTFPVLTLRTLAPFTPAGLQTSTQKPASKPTKTFLK